MPTSPADPPREPYRALAVFLLLPLVAAAVGAWRAPAETTPAPGAGLGSQAIGNPARDARLHPARPAAPARAAEPRPTER